MISVAGHLRVSAADRHSFLAHSRSAMEQAREARLPRLRRAPDPLDPGRVNVDERWADRSALDAFRGQGPGDTLRGLIQSAAVTEYVVAPDARSDAGVG